MLGVYEAAKRRPGWSETLAARVPPGTARRALLIFAPVAGVAILVFYLLFATQMSATQRVIAAGQKQLVDVGYTTVTGTLAMLGNDAGFVGDAPALQRWLASGSAEDRQFLQEQFLSFARHRGLYDQVRFIGLDGRESVRVDWQGDTPVLVPVERLQDKADRNYTRQGLKLERGEIFYSEFDLNVEHGVIELPIKPTIRVAAPVFDASGRKRGIVVLNYLGQRTLDRVRSLSSQGLGEAWLIDGKGRWMLGSDAADEWGSMYPERAERGFDRIFPAAWKILEKARGHGQFVAEGALFSYAAIDLPANAVTGESILSPATDAPSWYLVTHTPAPVYSQPDARTVLEYLAALLAVLILLGGIAWLVADHGERRREAERQVRELNQRLARDNATLQGLNRELESFSYSVSHDLRAPLRSIDGFSKALLEDYADQLDDTGRDYLNRVRNAAQRMGNLIDDLLKLARVSRTDLKKDRVDLGLVARRIVAELRQRHPQRVVDVEIAPDLVAEGDPRLLQIALENLLDNAWKFTAKRPEARIEFGRMERDGGSVFFVRDNGAGFDMAHADKLFGVFQRLHAMTEFEGTGVGLATVQRIIYKHGGRVWAEAERERGAVFHFAL
jgi:signal transduction histidine kinase